MHCYSGRVWNIRGSGKGKERWASTSIDFTVERRHLLLVAQARIFRAVFTPLSEMTPNKTSAIAQDNIIRNIVLLLANQIAEI